MGQELAALDPQGTLAAIVRLCPDGSLAPKINFLMDRREEPRMK